MSKLQIRRGRTDSCGLVTHQLLSLKLAMEKVAKDCGLPFLMSIPQNPEASLLPAQHSEISSAGDAI